MKHTISTLGSHSALDICEGAKQEGFNSLVIAQRGREKTYLSAYKTRKRGKKEIGVVDEVLLLDKFSEITGKKYIDFMEKRNSIFIPNRSFAVYVGYDNIESNFTIPVFGNKKLLRAEERDAEKNQYWLMDRAKIRRPKEISSPEKIDQLAIVKVSEAKRSYERAFFLARSQEEYQQKSKELLCSGKISEEGLKKAKIEEYIIGAHFNFNFFYSKVHGELELLGIDARRQTNLDGFLRMPADKQLDVLKNSQPSTIEVGHIACTLRESLLEQVFEISEKLVRVCEKEYEPGIIGPFALQGAIIAEDRKEEFVCFDISFRIPGSPGIRFTPYSGYLFRENLSFGRRIAMEIKEAEKKNKLPVITT
jgi:5-formaminoimidazole-4-carboxamide-1-(beta)-D-ribofuranosyl 5'-monophosphate synthetase